MKTQRRHELQTNMLADYLGRQLQQIQPYSKQITVVLVILAIVAGGYLYYTNRQNARSGASWSDFFEAFGARDARALEEVASLHSGTKAALWAQLSAADIKLATGAGLLFTDRDEAERSLKDAEKLFLAVETEAAGDPLLVQRARYGLAQVYESLCKIDKAKLYYEKVAQAAPASALGKAAKRRAERLADPSVQRWYAWFERQQPAPPTGAPGGQTGAPKVSDDLESLPSRPDLSLPGSGPGEEPKQTPASADQPAELPEASKQPATESPDEQAPSSHNDTLPEGPSAKSATGTGSRDSAAAAGASAKPAAHTAEPKSTKGADAPSAESPQPDAAGSGNEP